MNLSLSGPTLFYQAKAGMNGGMDFLCGRLVYYDEIPNDFASTDSDRIEYLKSVSEPRQHSNPT